MSSIDKIFQLKALTALRMLVSIVSRLVTMSVHILVELSFVIHYNQSFRELFKKFNIENMGLGILD